MDILLFRKLRRQQLLTQLEYENIEQHEKGPVSVFWELTTLLYLGILLFTAGLGILVYKNINSIGHAAIIATIAIMCTAGFTYCLKNARGYSNQKVTPPTLLFDYVLLLACLLLVTFIGYLQFEYELFGTDWGLTTFIPMVLLFISAYYFDHLGVLSMAITNLAAWAGLTVAPLKIIEANNFRSEHIIFTGLILGAGLIAISFVSAIRQIKAHFSFTYKNFGTHLLLISSLAALFHFDKFYLLCFVVLIILLAVMIKFALGESSFYFLVVAFMYGYIGLSYVIIRFLLKSDLDDSGIYLGSIYFIASGIGLIRTLMYYNKTFKRHDNLQ